MLFALKLPAAVLALLAGCGTWLVTALGAAAVFFFSKDNEKHLTGMLGFAAGYDYCKMRSAGNQEMQYVLNIKSMKFHTPECSGGKSIKDENRQVVTCPREDLIQQGYEPCKSCNP